MKPPIARPLFAALLCGGLIAGTATAQTKAAAAPSFAGVMAGLEAKGYRILDAETDDGWLEVEAIAANGQRVDLLVAPADGSIRHERPDR